MLQFTMDYDKFNALLAGNGEQLSGTSLSPMTTYTQPVVRYRSKKDAQGPRSNNVSNPLDEGI
jgi:hypothetical protein